MPAAASRITIDVRSRAVCGKHVQVVDDALAQVSMQVIARADQATGSDDSARRRDPVPFRIVHPLHKQSAMHGQIQPIERQQGLERLQKLLFQCFVGLTLYRATGDRACVNGGEKNCASPRAESENAGAATSASPRSTMKSSRRVSIPAVRAALNMNAAKGKPHALSRRSWHGAHDANILTVYKACRRFTEFLSIPRCSRETENKCHSERSNKPVIQGVTRKAGYCSPKHLRMKGSIGFSEFPQSLNSSRRRRVWVRLTGISEFLRSSMRSW